MAGLADVAWDVCDEPELEPDKTRMTEIIWPELEYQGLDVSDINKKWLIAYSRKYGIE